MLETNEALQANEPDYKAQLEELKLKYEEAQKLLGKRSFIVPDENSSEEQINEILKKIGAPDSPEGYQFDEKTLFEGYDQDLVKEYRDNVLAELRGICHEMKMPKNMASKFVSLMAKKSKKSLQDQVSAYEKQREEDEKYLNSQLDEVFGAKKVEYLNRYSTVFENLDLSSRQKAKLLVKMKDIFPMQESATIPNSGLPKSSGHSNPLISQLERLMIQQGRRK